MPTKTAYIMVRCSPKLKEAIKNLRTERGLTETSLVFRALADFDPKLRDVITEDRI